MPKPRNSKMRYRQLGNFHAEALEKDLKKMQTSTDSIATLRSDAPNLDLQTIETSSEAKDAVSSTDS